MWQTYKLRMSLKYLGSSFLGYSILLGITVFTLFSLVLLLSVFIPRNNMLFELLHWSSSPHDKCRVLRGLSSLEVFKLHLPSFKVLKSIKFSLFSVISFKKPWIPLTCPHWSNLAQNRHSPLLFPPPSEIQMKIVLNSYRKQSWKALK